MGICKLRRLRGNRGRKSVNYGGRGAKSVNFGGKPKFLHPLHP